MKVCIIGSGTVGFQKAYDVLMSPQKHEVVLMDIFEVDPIRIEHLAGRVNLDYQFKYGKRRGLKSKNIKTTTSLVPADVYWICIPTLMANDKLEEKSFMDIAGQLKAMHGIDDYMLINSTTTPIGFNPYFSKYAISKHKELYAYIPERLNDDHNFEYNHYLSKYIGLPLKQITPIKAFIQTIYPVAEYVTLQEAEFIKLADLMYRAMNISFIDEMSVLASTSLDSAKVMNHVRNVISEQFDPARPTAGVVPYPGTGLGGDCISKGFQLIRKNMRMSDSFIMKAKDVSEYKQNFVVDQILNAFKDKMSKYPDLRLELYGLTFKPNASSIKKSTAVTVAIKLAYQSNISKFKNSPSVNLMERMTIFEPLIKETLPEILHFAVKKFDPEQIKTKPANVLRVLLVDHRVFDSTNQHQNFDLIFSGRHFKTTI